jgi:hypothetical protein
MAGKEFSKKSGKEGSSRRSQARRTAGEEDCFSLVPCTAIKHMAVEEAFTGEGGFSLGQCATKHMAVEEPVIGEEGAFSLRPCATKLMPAEEGVTGDKGSSKGCPTKRKAAGSDCAAVARFPKAGECEALDRSPPIEQWHVASWNSNLPESGALEPMAVDLILEKRMMSDQMLRERVKATLVTFPEAAALDPDQLDVAVDRIIKQSKPETASPTVPGMRRLSDEDIGAFFYHKTDIPTIADLSPCGVFPAGWIEERRQQLEEEVQLGNKKFGNDLDVLLAKIRVDLLTKGYVDVPELYFQDTPDVQYARMEAVKMEQAHKEYNGVAGADDEQWWLDDSVLARLVLQSI